MFRGGFQRCPNDGSLLDDSGNDPLVGSVLAERYEIEDVIGDGGIGRVYRARHVRMSRRFAIKIPFGELGYDRKARARFANEAEAASRLSHPNVIGVVDVGETSAGLFYMAMDLAEGPSLGDVISDGPIPPARALPMIVQLADGLAHAHDRGLVHRDLKPENVILTGSASTPQVRIVDFGLAIVADRKVRDRLTTEGIVLGTPHYMAPEQATDDDLDFRVDLFALGIILFEMLAGVHPFDGAPMDVARQNLSRDLPSILERSGVHVDPLLEALVSWLTRKVPEQRPGHASQVGQFARHLAAGQRGAAHAMLPAIVPVRELGAIVEVTDDDLGVPADMPVVGSGPVSFPPADRSAPVLPVPATAPTPPAASPTPPTATPPPPTAPTPAPPQPVPVMPKVADVRPPTTERVVPAPSSLRRWLVVALVLVALAGGVLVIATLGERKQSVAVAGEDAALLVLAPDAGEVDAPAVVLLPEPDAAVMLDQPIDARIAVTRRVDAAAIVRAPPVDAAAVVRAPPVDAAAVVRAPPIDAPPAIMPDPPAATLKGLYEQVGRGIDAAMAKRGRDATQALRDRYARIPPYLEAVRKPELRAQAEAQLKALLRDLAALK